MKALEEATIVESNKTKSCFYGSAPGSWRPCSCGSSHTSRPCGCNAPEWQLAAPGCSPLRRYVWVDPAHCGKPQPSIVPNAAPSNLPTCVQRDNPLLAADLNNLSVLMIGDSTTTQLLMHSCEAFTSRPKPFVSIDGSLNLTQYWRRLRSPENHACEARMQGQGGFVIGSFSHFGITGPPYWEFAYPLPPWLSSTLVGMVRNDMPRFRQHVRGGGDPAVVIAAGGYWDIARWWAHLSNYSIKHWSFPLDTPDANYTSMYLHGVHRFVLQVRRSFPRSLVVWRLMHLSMKNGISPRVVKRFNSAVRAAALGWQLPLFDVEGMMASLSKSTNPGLGRGAVYGLQDGLHLHPWLNVALLNVILNLARDHGRVARL